MKLILSLVIALSAACLYPEENPGSKSPFPSQDEANAALGTIKDVFKDEYKGLKTSDDRRILAKKFIRQAVDPSNSPAMVYALISEAARIAADAGDVESVAEASFLLSEQFYGEDVYPARYKMLKAVESSKAKLPPEDMAVLGEEYLKFADETISNEDFNDALQLAADAGAIAVKAKNKELAAKALEKKKEKSKSAKIEILSRAAVLYGKILSQIGGIDKAKAEKRIAQAAADAEAAGGKEKSKHGGGEYLIVDLTSRKLAYSVSAPTDLLTNDIWKNDKLVMRRVPSGMFTRIPPVPRPGRPLVLLKKTTE